MADKRCVFMALDGQKSGTDALVLERGVMSGPMAPYIRGVKGNDLLHAPWGGVRFLEAVLGDELEAWPDMKLVDIRDTDLNTLRHYAPLNFARCLVTVSVHSSVDVFVGLAQNFPDLGVIVFGVGTDIKAEEFAARYNGMTPAGAMEQWYGALVAEYRKVTGATEAFPTRYAISSYDMLGMFAEKFPGVGCITPGIRDEWMLKQGQKRTAGVYDALKAGAVAVVMGNQLYNGNPAAGVDARESQARTAVQIEKYLAETPADLPDDPGHDALAGRTTPEPQI